MRGPGQRERAAGCVRRLGQESRHLRSAPRATRWPRRNRASRRAPATSRRVLARLHPSRLTRQRSSRPPGSAPPASTPCACDTLEGSADRLPRLMADRRPTKRRHRRWSGRPQRARPRQGWRRPRHCEVREKRQTRERNPPLRTCTDTTHMFTSHRAHVPSPRWRRFVLRVVASWVNRPRSFFVLPSSRPVFSTVLQRWCGQRST